jgi:hypothetical protein
MAGDRNPTEKRSQMANDRITLELDRGDAEVLLGILASERHNADAEAVCDSIRKQLDEKLAELG